MFCKNCGIQIFKESNFCHSCGDKVIKLKSDNGAESVINSVDSHSGAANTLITINKTIDNGQKTIEQKLIDGPYEVKSSEEKSLVDSTYKVGSSEEKKLVDGTYTVKGSDKVGSSIPVKVRNPWSKKKKLVTLVVSSLSVVILAGFITNYVVYLPDRKYAYAVSLMDDNHYEQAIQEFKKMGPFKDSADLITESNYLFAKKLITEKEYVRAKEIILSLDSYKDSHEIILQMDYTSAEHFLESKEYKKAIELFEKSIDYKDSKQLLNKAKYLYGKELVNEKKYIDAIAVLEDIKDYGDSRNILIETRYQEGVNRYNEGEFSGAKQFLSSIGDGKYKDVNKYFNNIKLIESVRGTWKSKYGSRIIVFSKNKVTDIFFPDSHKTKVYTWDLSVVNGMLHSSAGDKYHIKSGNLYSGDSVYLKESSSTVVPKENPSPKIGMTASEIRLSNWGSPKDINRTTTKYGVREQWVYGGSQYIYLEDGIVTSIQE